MSGLKNKSQNKQTPNKQTKKCLITSGDGSYLFRPGDIPSNDSRSNSYYEEASVFTKEKKNTNKPPNK